MVFVRELRSFCVDNSMFFTVSEGGSVPETN